jgi:hypothetical protein
MCVCLRERIYIHIYLIMNDEVKETKTPPSLFSVRLLTPPHLKLKEKPKLNIFFVVTNFMFRFRHTLFLLVS